MSLTEQHRQQQLAVRVRTLGTFARLWPALDWTRLDATFPLFVSAVAGLVEQNRAESSRLAAAYVASFRASQGVTSPWTLHLAPPVDAARLNTSLRVTALVSAKAAAAKDVRSEIAMRNAFTLAAGAVSRHVLDGGRETVRRTVLGDPAALGWRRVASGSACGFCRMLAGRGAVYREETGGFRSHDSCGCTAEPVFRD